MMHSKLRESEVRAKPLHCIIYINIRLLLTLLLENVVGLRFIPIYRASQN